MLRKLGLDDGDAYTLGQERQNMSAANRIARFESKLDSLREEIRGQRAMIWALIGILGAAVGAGIVALLIQALKS